MKNLRILTTVLCLATSATAFSASTSTAEAHRQAFLRSYENKCDTAFQEAMTELARVKSAVTTAGTLNAKLAQLEKVAMPKASVPAASFGCNVWMAPVLIKEGMIALKGEIDAILSSMERADTGTAETPVDGLHIMANFKSAVIELAKHFFPITDGKIDADFEKTTAYDAGMAVASFKHIMQKIDEATNAVRSHGEYVAMETARVAAEEEALKAREEREHEKRELEKRELEQRERQQIERQQRKRERRAQRKRERKEAEGAKERELSNISGAPEFDRLQKVIVGKNPTLAAQTLVEYIEITKNMLRNVYQIPIQAKLAVMNLTFLRENSSSQSNLSLWQDFAQIDTTAKKEATTKPLLGKAHIDTLGDDHRHDTTKIETIINDMVTQLVTDERQRHEADEAEDKRLASFRAFHTVLGVNTEEEDKLAEKTEREIKEAARDEQKVAADKEEQRLAMVEEVARDTKTITNIIKQYGYEKLVKQIMINAFSNAQGATTALTLLRILNVNDSANGAIKNFALKEFRAAGNARSRWICGTTKAKSITDTIHVNTLHSICKLLEASDIQAQLKAKTGLLRP